ncbi:MAG: hypothetical protein CL397_00725 [Acidiferrobacteraceae bacterium]|nr:hypothetical protein [Acidiferrobacteraceae bacterium]
MRIVTRDLKHRGLKDTAVMRVLPAQTSPVLSGELIYTGVTRAQRSLAIWGSSDVLTGTIGHSALPAWPIGYRARHGLGR